MGLVVSSVQDFLSRERERERKKERKREREREREREWCGHIQAVLHKSGTGLCKGNTHSIVRLYVV